MVVMHIPSTLVVGSSNLTIRILQVCMKSFLSGIMRVDIFIMGVDIWTAHVVFDLDMCQQTPTHLVCFKSKY